MGTELPAVRVRAVNYFEVEVEEIVLSGSSRAAGAGKGENRLRNSGLPYPKPSRRIRISCQLRTNQVRVRGPGRIEEIGQEKLFSYP